MRVVRSAGRGPAAARNLGWQAGASPWVVFLDDDVAPDATWAAELARDLLDAQRAGDPVAAVQGRLVVALPTDRRPTDREREVAGLVDAPWISADIALRRDVLETVGGFDERFPRAYREDAELALRVIGTGRTVRWGGRQSRHPTTPAPWYHSVRRQLGNVDDALVTALHGPDWRTRAGSPPGRRRRHVAVTAAGVGALAGVALTRRTDGRARRTVGHAAIVLGSSVWAGGVGELAWHRILEGPRDRREVATMLSTSALLPPTATLASLAGALWARWLTRAGGRPDRPDGMADRGADRVGDSPAPGVGR